MSYIIRQATIEDASQLIEIYSYYVLNTAVTFEYKVPTLEEFCNRIDNISKKYPYLVCELDGTIVGYAYANTYSSREAYDWTATSSIYIDKEHRRMGIGSLLYAELEKQLRAQGIVNLLAAIAYIDEEDEYLCNDSSRFHQQKGYTKVAHMTKIGKKFDRWYDILWMQKVL